MQHTESSSGGGGGDFSALDLIVVTVALIYSLFQIRSVVSFRTVLVSSLCLDREDQQQRRGE